MARNRAARPEAKPLRLFIAVDPSPQAVEAADRALEPGLEDDEGSLPALAKALDAALEEEFPPEKRAFAAHLTVARFDPPTDLSGTAEEMEGFRVDARPFRVSKLLLYQSHLSPRGARYEVLEAFPLGAVRS